MTDLDGSLLDHHTYSFQAALPALKYIEQNNLPLIFNSSKTAAEIIELQNQMGIAWPFVVENGAGIYLSQEISTKASQDTVFSFGKSRSEILVILQKLREKHGFSFLGFNDMSDAELQSHTHLSMDKILLAKQRDYSEPMLWLDSEAQWQEFMNEIKQQELVAVKGGRFISVTSQVNKANAISWFKHYYQNKFQEDITIIALGDGENDINMLQNADYGILIKSPSHTIAEQSIKNLIQTNHLGPEGWNQSLLSLIETLRN